MANIYEMLRRLRTHILMFIFMHAMERHTAVFERAPFVQDLLWALYTVAAVCMPE